MDSVIEALNSYEEEIVNAKGIILNIDNIECYGLWGKIKKISFLGRVIYKGLGEAIFVDKNRDLSYYVKGKENGRFYDNNLAVHFGCEWGGYGEETRIQNTCVGAGFSNTNSLMAMGLTPHTSGCYVVWDKIKKFRKFHSNNWFLPSKDELNLIYEAKSNLSNLSLNTNSYYWSSSETSSFITARKCVWGQDFNKGCQDVYGKYYHLIRSRLCVQY